VIRPLVLAAMVACSVGCQQAKSAESLFDKIAGTVENDLSVGASDAQIASDVCADLGGTTSTDAICADAEPIVQSVVTILVDSGVLTGASLANAKSYQARHPKPVAKAP